MIWNERQARALVDAGKAGQSQQPKTTAGGGRIHTVVMCLEHTRTKMHTPTRHIFNRFCITACFSSSHPERWPRDFARAFSVAKNEGRSPQGAHTAESSNAATIQSATDKMKAAILTAQAHAFASRVNEDHVVDFETVQGREVASISHGGFTESCRTGGESITNVSGQAIETAGSRRSPTFAGRCSVPKLSTSR